MADAPHPVDQHVGQRLRSRRVERGVTQTELGGELGLSAQQVQKYENGTNRISASKLFEAAGKLGTTVDWFFDGLSVQLAEPAESFEPAPTPHDRTRELIAAFKALPDDAARLDVMAYIKRRSGEGI